MNQGPDDSLLAVGKVLRPHGLRGLLRIQVYADSGSIFDKAGKVFLKLESAECLEFTFNSLQPVKSNFILKLEELASLNEAEKYRGAEILVRKDALPPREDDEYFWFELVGLDVFSENGEYLGPIIDIISTGGHDTYVVKGGKGEILIPGTHETVKDIDLERRKMTISPIEGLLDINEI
ncbi:MAG: ribosome maturation factor RimM [Desulfatiglandaceae bacterium]